MTSTFAFEQLDAVEHRGAAVTPAQRAAEIVAAAEAQAAAIADAAAAEARERGFAQGRDEALASMTPAREALEAATAALAEAHAELAASLERRAAELAVAVAEKIVGAELATRPELVLEVLTGALRGAAERDRLVVEVNPDDLELVRDAAAGLAASLGGIASLDVVAERRVGRGGCVVRTLEGEIDATLAGQLERARETLLAALGASRA